MTLDEIRNLDREYLLPREVASILGCKPYAINVWAKQNPKGLGFPTCVIGSRVKVPRLAFIQWLTGQNQTARCAEPDGD